MTRQVTRRSMLGAGLAALGTAALAEAPMAALRPLGRPAMGTGGPVTDLRPRARVGLSDMVRQSRLTGHTGVVALDAVTGEVIESHRPDLYLPPASVAKSATALYALEALGPDHRFATRLLATGPIADGRLEGDLILAGEGDPLLSTDDLAGLAAGLSAAGVREVTGAFRLWTSGLPDVREIDEGQLDHLGYNPAISGLNLNFNRVHFEWTRQGSDYQVLLDARSESLRPGVAVARMEVVDRRLPVYTYEDSGGVDAWTVARGALGEGGSRWLPVRRPAAYCGDVFRTLARSRGILLDAPSPLESAPAQAREIARHESPALEEILQGMLLYSTNLTAEAVGLAASRARGAGLGALQGSAEAMTEWLADRHGILARFVDHSGLGDASRISPRQMARLLLSAGPDGALRPLLKRISLTDTQGRPLEPQPALVRAKTGTLDFVSALAGYVTARSGRDVVFAIQSADYSAREISKASGDERPEGTSYWNGRAKWLQQKILQRWGSVLSV